MRPSQQHSTSPLPALDPHTRRSNAKRAGTLLLLAAAANAVMVITRVVSDADQPTLAESLAAIADSQAVYAMTGAARLLSGVLLAAAAWFMWRTWAVPYRPRTPPALVLLAVSGALTAVSGACALILAAAAPAAAEAAAMSAVEAQTETAAYLRWLTGKLGFTAAGLGLAAMAIHRPPAGDPMRQLPWALLAIGISMQLIWVDSATLIHRLTGTAFFAWLLATGITLVRFGAGRGRTPAGEHAAPRS